MPPVLDPSLLPAYAAALGFGYLCGSIPFGLLLTRLAGTGVATYIGLLLALAWPIAIAFALIWLAVVALSRYSSLAALLASAATPVALWMIGDQPAAVLFTLLSVLLWIMHRSNIARLARGTESKLGASTRA